MHEEAEVASTWPWDWQELGIGSLLAVRDCSPEALIRVSVEAYGYGSSKPWPGRGWPTRVGEWLTVAQVSQQLPSACWVRIGQVGAWTVALYSSELRGELGRFCLQRLSTGRELVSLEAGWFWQDEQRLPEDNWLYYVDGELVTAFGLQRAHERWGREPDRFLAAMRQVGLPVDGSSPRQEPGERPASEGGNAVVASRLRRAALALLDRALGLRLPRAVVAGPLLTIPLSEWHWVSAFLGQINLVLWCVRERTPEQLLSALGLDPATAQLEPLTLIDEETVRSVQVGAWAFALDFSYRGGREPLWGWDQTAQALSMGTEVALFQTNPKVTSLAYFADGEKVCEFEPFSSCWRFGSEPDRFVEQMRQVGLAVDPSPQLDESAALTATLALLREGLGIPLPPPLQESPLLTAPPSAWQWREDEEALLLLLLVRGAEPEHLLHRWVTWSRADPASAHVLARDEAWALLPAPSAAWLRAGRVGEWAVLLVCQHPPVDWQQQQQWLQELAAETELIKLSRHFTHGLCFDTLAYSVNGELVTAFDPVHPESRHGQDPDRLMEAMRQVGLQVTVPPEEVAEAERDQYAPTPELAALELLTRALGIRLPAAVVEGPLLTVRVPPAQS
jgi:hypothetical protein